MKRWKTNKTNQKFQLKGIDIFDARFLCVFFLSFFIYDGNEVWYKQKASFNFYKPHGHSWQTVISVFRIGLWVLSLTSIKSSFVHTQNSNGEFQCKTATAQRKQFLHRGLIADQKQLWNFQTTHEFQLKTKWTAACCMRRMQTKSGLFDPCKQQEHCKYAHKKEICFG